MAVDNGILNLSGAIKLRGGRAADLESVNPVVNSREIIIETDTGKIKAGKKLSRGNENYEYNWNDLDYVGGWLSEELYDIKNSVDVTALHNSIKAGNLISKEEALTAISSGNFKNMFAGTGIGNIRSEYMVLDINYFYGDSTGRTRTPHAIVTPCASTAIIVQAAENFASGGYYGFTELRNALTSMAENAVAYFGEEHVLTHSEYLCDGISNGEPSSYGWYESQCELMTLQQVYGSQFYSSSAINNLNANQQFSYYKLSRNDVVVEPRVLRDVASADSLWEAVIGGCPEKVTIANETMLITTPYLCIC